MACYIFIFLVQTYLCQRLKFGAVSLILKITKCISVYVNKKLMHTVCGGFLVKYVFNAFFLIQYIVSFHVILDISDTFDIYFVIL